MMKGDGQYRRNGDYLITKKLSHTQEGYLLQKITYKTEYMSNIVPFNVDKIEYIFSFLFHLFYSGSAEISAMKFTEYIEVRVRKWYHEERTKHVF